MHLQTFLGAEKEPRYQGWIKNMERNILSPWFSMWRKVFEGLKPWI
jgi:hypothetical protein